MEVKSPPISISPSTYCSHSSGNSSSTLINHAYLHTDAVILSCRCVLRIRLCLRPIDHEHAAAPPHCATPPTSVPPSVATATWRRDAVHRLRWSCPASPPRPRFVRPASSCWPSTGSRALRSAGSCCSSSSNSKLNRSSPSFRRPTPTSRAGDEKRRAPSRIWGRGCRPSGCSRPTSRSPLRPYVPTTISVRRRLTTGPIFFKRSVLTSSASSSNHQQDVGNIRNLETLFPNNCFRNIKIVIKFQVYNKKEKKVNQFIFCEYMKRMNQLLSLFIASTLIYKNRFSIKQEIQLPTQHT